jgi:hypothetical protein
MKKLLLAGLMFLAVSGYAVDKKYADLQQQSVVQTIGIIEGTSI